MKKNLHNEMGFIDYVHVLTNFLVSNGKNISKIRKSQGNKLHILLLLNNSYHNPLKSHDPDKVIFIFGGYVLNTTEKSLLSK